MAARTLPSLLQLRPLLRAAGVDAWQMGATACPSWRWSAAAWGSSRGVSGVSAPSPSRLDQVMKVDSLADKSPEEVAEIWQQFHDSTGDDANKTRAGSVLSSTDYQKLASRARESPMFILPMRRAGGAPGSFETFVLNMQMPFVLLTSLEEFKRSGASAPPHVVVTHYLELLDSKGVVLARGDIIEKSMTKGEARTLMELTRALYCSEEDYALVQAFNKRPQDFDFSELLKKLGLQENASGQQ